MKGNRKEGDVSSVAQTVCLLMLILLMPVSAVWGQQESSLQKAAKEGPVQIESDRLSYDQVSDTYRAEGDVVITFTGGFLKADSVTLNRATGDAWAHGHAYLFSEGDILEGDIIQVNLETKKGIARDGRMFFIKNHLYVTGGEIEKSGEATYRIKDGTATTCDGPLPDWRFTGKEVDVTVDGYGTLKSGTFQIRDTPVAWFPWLMFPAKTTRQTGLLFPYFGYSADKLGVDVEIPFYWAISDKYDATLYTRYMDKRGLKEGAEFRYHPTSSTFGLFYGDFLKDQWTGSDTSGGIPRNWTEKQDRWSWYWNHETTFAPGLYFRADLMKISDIYYFRDFGSHNYYLDHYAGSINRKFDRISFVGNEQLTSYDSTARLVKEWQNYNLTAWGQYTDNLTSLSNADTLQRYPEVTFTGFKQPLAGTRLNWEVASRYGYYYRDYGVRGSAFDVYPKVSLPWAFGNYVTVTPELGVRETLWDTQSNDPTVPGTSSNRALYTVALGAATEVFRIFDTGWGQIQKVKHAVKPEVTYTYIPSVDQMVRPDFVTGVDSKNGFTYALTNTLIGRVSDEKGSVSYLEALRLKLSQTYNITPPTLYLTTPPPVPLDKPFGPLDAELDINPFPYLGFMTRASFDFNTNAWARLDQDIALKDDRGDSLSFVYRYTKNSIESAGVVGRVRTTSFLDIFAGFRENLFDKTTLEKTVGLEFHRQCWGLEVSYSDLVDDRRFMVLFSLSGLGRVGGGSVSRQGTGF
jgi:LPS-assembly protein